MLCEEERIPVRRDGKECCVNDAMEGEDKRCCVWRSMVLCGR